MEYNTVGIKNYTKNHPIFVAENVPFNIEPAISDRLRVILIKKDSGTIKINGKEIPFFEPSVFCINETETIEVPALVNGAISVYFDPVFIIPSMNFSVIRKPKDELPTDVLFNRLLTWPFVNRNKSYNGVINLTETTALRMESIMLSLKKELAEQPDGWWPCKSRGYLTELLYLIGRLSTDSFETDEQSVSNAPPEIMPVLSYLLNNYKNKITLNELAKTFLLNRTSLNDRIKKYTGLSAISYLIKIRLRIAALLIKNTELPVSEVTIKAGFENLTHFGRLFKRFYKKTPSEFKKSMIA